MQEYSAISNVTAGFLSKSSVNLQWKIIFILIFVTGITLLNTNFMLFIERLHTYNWSHTTTS